jgi:hypothetical protein
MTRKRFGIPEHVQMSRAPLLFAGVAVLLLIFFWGMLISASRDYKVSSNNISIASDSVYAVWHHSKYMLRPPPGNIVCGFRKQAHILIKVVNTSSTDAIVDLASFEWKPTANMGPDFLTPPPTVSQPPVLPIRAKSYQIAEIALFPIPEEHATVRMFLEEGKFRYHISEERISEITDKQTLYGVATRHPLYFPRSIPVLRTEHSIKRL